MLCEQLSTGYNCTLSCVCDLQTVVVVGIIFYNFIDKWSPGSMAFAKMVVPDDITVIILPLL
jgi:hypothetical protein